MPRVALLLVAALAAVVEGLLIAPLAPRATAARALVSCAASPKPTDADGNEIKAALSSYMLFCGEYRAAKTAELKASMGASFKQSAVMSALGADWKALSEADKTVFQELAVADKARYDAAFASNPANVKPKKKMKASTGPKKLSAYMHFCAERRPSITAELKASMGATFKQPAVMSALGTEWKLLGEADKARFQALAAVPVA